MKCPPFAFRLLAAIVIFAASLSAQTIEKPPVKESFLHKQFYPGKVGSVLLVPELTLATMDNVETRQRMQEGWYETDPLVRPFVHNSKTLAAWQAGETLTYLWVSARMHHSRNKWVRRMAWSPIGFGIVAHVIGYRTGLK